MKTATARFSSASLSSSLAPFFKRMLIIMRTGELFVVALVLMTFLTLNIKTISSDSSSSHNSSLHGSSTSNDDEKDGIVIGADDDYYSSQDADLLLITDGPLLFMSRQALASHGKGDRGGGAQDDGNEVPKGRKKIDSSMINGVARSKAGEQVDSKTKVIDINGINSGRSGARTAMREVTAAPAGQVAEFEANQAAKKQHQNQHNKRGYRELNSGADQALNSSTRRDNKKREAPPLPPPELAATALNAPERSHDLTNGGRADPNETHKRVHNSNHDNNSPNGLGRNQQQQAKRRKRFQDSDRLRQIISDNDENSESITTTTTTITTIEPANALVARNPRESHSSSAGDDTSSLKCRVEKDLYLDFEEYKHYSCAFCYKLVPPMMFWLKFDYDKKSRIWLYDREHSRRMLPNDTETIKSTFRDQGTFAKWQECCRQAIECCKTNAKYLPKSYNSKGELVDETPRDKCPATWDGLRCWPDSPAGECAEQECPEHVYFLEFTPVCRGYVQKECFENGSWFIRDNDHEWSDYTRCSVLDLYATRLFIGSVWYLVSAIVIGPAWIILDKFPNRSRTKRVKILSKLLFWLLLNALLAATQKFGIIGGVFDANSNREVPMPPSSPLVGSELTTRPTTTGGPSALSTAANSADSQSHLNAVALHSLHSSSSSFPGPPLPSPLSLSELQDSPSNHLAPLATTARPAVTMRLARRQVNLDQADSLSGAMTTTTTTTTTATATATDTATANSGIAGSSSSAHSFIQTSLRGNKPRLQRARFYYKQLAQSNGYANAYDFDFYQDDDDDNEEQEASDDLDEQKRPATSARSDYDGYNITEKDGSKQQQSDRSAIIAPPTAREAEDDDRQGKNAPAAPDSDIRRNNRAQFHHTTTSAAIAGDDSNSWVDWLDGPDNLRREQTAKEEEGRVEYAPNAAAVGSVIISSLVGDGKHEMPDNNIVSKPNNIINSSTGGDSKEATEVARTVIEDKALGNVPASSDDGHGGDLDSPTLVTATTTDVDKSTSDHLSSSVLHHQVSRANIRRRRPRQAGVDTGSGSDKNKLQMSPELSTSSLESAERAATSSNSGSTRCKPRFQQSPKKHSHIAVVFVCWTLSVGIRITRLLGYAWMFTGAVYLCSVLHFAPAEPPTSFIKWLLILTNGFPIVIGMIYVIVRSIYEPSPLTLAVKSPYYYLVGDSQYIEYLFASQLDCWMLQSQYDSIEDIADLPNLVLIILNGGLFIITLIIMCRISRPGSTRPEMSIGDYCKAAGTLVVLYGAHYALFVYMPSVEGCVNGQIMYYSLLFVDGIQGIAVSYVFCYRTAEGKEIISKYRTNWHQNRRLCCKLSDNNPHNMSKKREYGLLGSHNSRASNQNATTDKNNVCNGKEMPTEHICIHDITHTGGEF